MTDAELNTLVVAERAEALLALLNDADGHDRDAVVSEALAFADEWRAELEFVAALTSSATTRADG